MIERLSQIRVIMLDWGGTLARLNRQEAAIERCTDSLLDYLRTSGIQVSATADSALRQRFCDSAAVKHATDDLLEFDTGVFLKAWAKDQGVALPEGRALDDAVDAAWQPWAGCLDLIGNAKASLRLLSDSAYTLGLVSNVAAPNHICRQELARLGIVDDLAFVVFSSDIGWRKPSPRMYQAALLEARRQAPGLQAGHVLFVGDTVSADIEGPSDMGFNTALVRTGNWDGNEKRLARIPDLILDSIDALPSKLAAAADRV